VALGKGLLMTEESALRTMERARVYIASWSGATQSPMASFELFIEFPQKPVFGQPRSWDQQRV
jgi:hypothetical protein